MKMKAWSEGSSWRNKWFFNTAAKNLRINEIACVFDNSNGNTNLINKATNKFKNHPSILLIPSKVTNDSAFFFNEASLSLNIEK